MDGRLIPCTVCGFPWRVIEIPIGGADWQVDQERYVCPHDRRPAQGQMEIAADELVDELPYDTALVRIPYA